MGVWLARNARAAAGYPELTQLEGVRADHAQNGELILAAIAEAPELLLLDARNLAALMNGSRAILGLATLHRAPDRGIGLWVSADAATGHSHRRFRTGPFTMSGLSLTAAAVRLSQPGTSSDVESLERVAGDHRLLDSRHDCVGHRLPCA